MATKRRHIRTFDLSAITDPAHLEVIQGALNACDYPFGRIRRRTGKKVPVAVTDTSRFQRARAGGDGHDHHDHSHAEGFHALEHPDHRAAALGLYWLPTAEHPAGRIEVSKDIMHDVPLAQEVFLAEAAHAVDYGVMTDAQRNEIFAIVHRGDTTQHGTHGWWEERGGQRYWNDWVGENFMALFMRAFAKKLPRPLEAEQPWEHRCDDEMARQTRKLLKRVVA